MAEETYCANPDCPERPRITGESDRTPYDERTPCPACGSRARMFAVTVHDYATATDGAAISISESATVVVDPAILTLSGVDPEVTTGADVGVDGALGERAGGVNGLSLITPGLDLSHGVVVMFRDLTDEPDAACLLEVRDMEGNTLVWGAGASPGDALAYAFNYMLPPTASEYLPPDDEMPKHDSF